MEQYIYRMSQEEWCMVEYTEHWQHKSCIFSMKFSSGSYSAGTVLILEHLLA